jgi:hypothetical protein
MAKKGSKASLNQPSFLPIPASSTPDHLAAMETEERHTSPMEIDATTSTSSHHDAITTSAMIDSTTTLKPAVAVNDNEASLLVASSSTSMAGDDGLTSRAVEQTDGVSLLPIYNYK